MSKITVNYVTSNQFKEEENKILLGKCKLRNGELVGTRFDFSIKRLDIDEMLEVDILKMAEEEVVKAYEKIRVPCIVEHAGLIFRDYLKESYPGGLTKEMWNKLGDNFSKETCSENRDVIARAVVAYCDGKKVKKFVGETKGKLLSEPRGDRKFYWDTIFVPEGEKEGKTYAEIVKEKGLEYKVVNLSQSTKAMLQLLEYLLQEPVNDFWP